MVLTRQFLLVQSTDYARLVLVYNDPFNKLKCKQLDNTKLQNVYVDSNMFSTLKSQT